MALLGSAFASGCGRSSLPGAGPAILASRGSLPLARTREQTSYVYAIGCCGVFNNGAIDVYDLSLTHTVRRIFRGSVYAHGVAVDTAGIVYLLNVWDGVVEYDPGKEWPSRKLHPRLPGAIAMALDASNNLYVINCYSCMPYGARRAIYSNHDAIDVYRSGTTKLERTITRGIESPQALAFDSAGKLYVADATATPSIAVYEPGASRPSRRIENGLQRLGPMAVDGAGDVYVANNSDEVIEYAAGSQRVLRTLKQGISSPQGLLLDSSGTLYVNNTDRYPDRGWISVYASGGSQLSYEITNGIDNPVAIALGPDGSLYVSNDNWAFPRTRGRVSVYAPGATMPSHYIRGNKYGPPGALAIGGD
ncbi:MAG TPA: hypothetical protein VGX91_01225 [Candidatus Cybelea sp.]|nr:hypothetical protein [Candidatus Cybelea sp.]